MENNQEKLLERLRVAFTGEAQERLQGITTGLLELEKAPPAEERAVLVEGIYRNAHSLKGAARSVDRTDLEGVCQALEEVFAGWKRAEEQPDPGIVDTLLQAVEGLSALVRVADKTQLQEADRLSQEILALAGRNKRSALREQKSSGDKAAGKSAGAATPAHKTVMPVTKPPSSPAQEIRQETVRIRWAKLDEVIRRAQDMVGVRLSAEEQVRDLRELHTTVTRWRKKGYRSQTERKPNRSGLPPVILREDSSWEMDCLRLLDGRLTALLISAQEHARRLDQRVNQLLEDSKELLLFSFSSILEAIPKLVRDLSKEEGKEVEVVILGAEIEIDKRILDEIKDPLIHLVRNCVDHGLEKPERREKVGKPRRGNLTIAVSQEESDKVEIAVCDDGAGIDTKRLRETAVRSGAMNPEKAAALSEEEALQLVFVSGISTSPRVTDVSGRGLGLSIVREKAEELGGLVRVETIPGKGSSFRMLLPLTLATFRAVLVRSAGCYFAIPTIKVERVGCLKREEVRTVENRETISLHGETISLVCLAQVLELPGKSDEGSNSVSFLVLSSERTRIAFGVDEIIAEVEILQKGLGSQLSRVRNIAGAGVLGSGRVIPVLNVSDLLKTAISVGAHSAVRAITEDKKIVQRNVLVVEDSVTARMLLQNILELAGYRVGTAVDGIDALTTLRTGEFDMVVSDVEMPRMNGFELTSAIRGDDRLRELPVVLVTALESREDRERGVEVGANAYIVKSSFDQSNLIEAVHRFVGEPQGNV